MMGCCSTLSSASPAARSRSRVIRPIHHFSVWIRAEATLLVFQGPLTVSAHAALPPSRGPLPQPRTSSGATPRGSSPPIGLVLRWTSTTMTPFATLSSTFPWTTRSPECAWLLQLLHY